MEGRQKMIMTKEFILSYFSIQTLKFISVAKWPDHKSNSLNLFQIYQPMSIKNWPDLYSYLLTMQSVYNFILEKWN